MSTETAPIIRSPYRPPQPADPRPRYACPKHGPLGHREVDSDHRCAHCRRPILAIRRLGERHDSLTLPRPDLEKILDECGCAHTVIALRELMEAHDAHL
ncbi:MULTISPECIES: hypothetical protein [Halomonas]|uniref:Uncharacterized protein n=1 Tax=Halomonas halophila TaxID=29573 RepID=A0ABQ0TZA2_9GAMM|nr:MULTISPECIES: hypothetical protein [Halomonas]MDR5889665.1 hypothetical protein [Halomonas salina]WJY06347.1 hypothetical protein QWG60_11580 [Halomonas halophila]GEK71566.1 hypothetical protein HHA04nite_01100 [Halomonas halophila]